jgi:predicted kinase
MEAVIFVGMQASGKTSFYLQKFADTHVRISLDVLKTRSREELLVAKCLADKRSFVVDNTNPLPSDRVRYIGRAHDAGFKVIAYSFETSLPDAIHRNNRRNAKERVPVPALASTYRKLQAPSFREGFDAIHHVTIGPDGQFTITADVHTQA